MAIKFTPFRRVNEILVGTYMESGFYDLTSAPLCSGASTRPASLEYTPSIAAYVASSLRPYQGRLLYLDGMYGGEQLADGSLSLSINCQTDRLSDKRACQQTVPASNFSGKLRLFVQAHYGSYKGNYELIEPLTKTISVAGATISPGYKFSYGLFTTSDYRYFLIRIGSTIQYFPLTLSGAGEAILNVVRAGGLSESSKKKLETYALSTATVGGPAINGDELDTGSGAPLAYGWHWKWDGSQGDVVVYSENTLTRRYDFTHYQLGITHAVGVGGADIFTTQLAIVSHGSYWPGADTLRVIKPIQSELSGFILPYVAGDAPAPSPTEPMDVTLYVYRSTTDELIICHYSQSFTLRSDTDSLPSEFKCYDEPAKFMDVTVYDGRYGTNLIAIGDYTLSGSVSTISSRTTREESAAVLGAYLGDTSSGDHFGFLANNRYACNGQTVGAYLMAKGYIDQYGQYKVAGGTATCGAATVDKYFRFRWYRPTVTWSWTLTINIESSSTHMLFEVPFNDCSAVYSSVRESDLGDIEYLYSYGPFDKNTEGFVEVWEAYLCGKWQYTSMVERIPLKRIPNMTGPVGEALPVVDSYTYTAHATIHKNAHGTDTSETFYSVSATENAPVAAAYQVMSNYYDTLLPLVGAYDEVKSSTSGDAKFRFNHVDYDEIEYPGDSSVGWG